MTAVLRRSAMILKRVGWSSKWMEEMTEVASETMWKTFLKIRSGMVFGEKFLITYLQLLIMLPAVSTQYITVPLTNSRESRIVKIPSALLPG